MAKPKKKLPPKAKKKVKELQPAEVAVEPSRPARAYGRSLSDFQPLMFAERTLLDACHIGKVAVISEQRPEEATEQNTVRAGFTALSIVRR